METQRLTQVHYPLNDVVALPSGKPTFVQCNTTVWGLLATENLEIKCGFRSWPAFSLLTWYAETTGQTIENDNSDEGLEAYVTVSTRVVGVFKYSEFSKINSQNVYNVSIYTFCDNGFRPTQERHMA